MFGIGMPELIVIMVIALIVFGPNKLPEIARSLGKGLAELKKASNEFQRSVHEEAYKAEVEDSKPKEHIANEDTVKTESQATATENQNTAEQQKEQEKV